MNASQREERLGARERGVYSLSMDHDDACDVPAAARRALEGADAPLLLAVSGGLDSMTLLSAMSGIAGARVAAVATFDHGTGPAATAAAAHVARVAAASGMAVVIGHARGDGNSGDGQEAAWRTERHRFLRETAAALSARIVTAHTEDDHLETVLMRIMRGSGVRGLAGLYADGAAARPFVRLRRATLASYAREAGVQWVEDLTNVSRAHLRNRLRLDLLPALRRVDPRVDAWLLDLSCRADRWRRELDRHVDLLDPRLDSLGRLRVEREQLAGYDHESLAVLWGALASRAGLALDRRGTRRIAAFTIHGPSAGSIPLAGGWCLDATRDDYVVGRAAPLPETAAPLPAQGVVRWGSFEFRVVARAPVGSPWGAALAAPVGAIVRAWAAGDRFGTGPARRRVRRYLSDAGVRGTDRAGWPVVVAGDDVVWIPGVRRSDAATDRSGRPVRHYVCERIDR